MGEHCELALHVGGNRGGEGWVVGVGTGSEDGGVGVSTSGGLGMLAGEHPR